MPIQIWTPQYRHADNAAIGAAIAGAGRSIGEGLSGIAERLERQKEEQKREQTNAKAADTLFKANPALQKLLGMDEHAYLGLPRRDRMAAVQGGITAITLQRDIAKAKAEQQEMESGQALQRVAGATSRGVLENYYENPEQFAQPPSFEQEMFNNPAAVNARNFSEFARSTRANADGDVPFFSPKDIGRGRPILGPDNQPIPGLSQVVIGPRTSQVVTDPTTPQRPGAPVQPRVVVGQNPLTGEPQVTWSGSPEEFESAFPHLAKPGKAGAGAKTGPLPMPKTKAELKAGQQYETNRGPATWDGEKFTLAK